jgi:hypothetical protein
MDVKTNTTDIIANAQDVLNNTLNRAGQSDIGTAVKNGLIESATSIQNILNEVFTNNGIMTTQQVDELDRQVELAKLKLLEAKSKSTILNLGMYVGIGVVVLGVLWYFTSKEK